VSIDRDVALGLSFELAWSAAAEPLFSFVVVLPMDVQPLGSTKACLKWQLELDACGQYYQMVMSKVYLWH
jgi:hypothetical protein